jgi:hypothetical protein
VRRTSFIGFYLGFTMRRTSFTGAVDSQCPRAGAESGRGTEADRPETVQEGLADC